MEITLLVLLPAARVWGDLRSLFSLQSVFLAAACRVPGARVRGGEGEGGRVPAKNATQLRCCCARGYQLVLC